MKCSMTNCKNKAIATCVCRKRYCTECKKLHIKWAAAHKPEFTPLKG